ncbi:FAD-binding and (Fe-S)-binding domain-containing protein [Ramlibacter rhizophilus]|uniref:FAD-binding oxidoreductase n=1 Tax=Ramlibacter rhizophilus TaxID=1781167 RepID=A0A4Z0BTR8_9BURK|nr:FAD-binding and (Fe-S)-binding domain-containing protein [Ramlibacter rhizophilus]TFZ01389.1 FAD-binding oxidoreductase [Ramlibacter rhizophilus]
MAHRHETAPDDAGLDARRLEADLRATVRGEVRFDAGSRALYATDASNYRQTPIGVVIPRDVDDVVATVAACHAHGAPLLSRGGGTSLCGQCCNVAVVLDFSKYMNQVLEIDPEARIARVQPGCVLDDLRHAARDHDLTFAPDPATHTHNTLGGMIGNNSCGPHSVMGGETVHNVIELDILTYDGLRMTVGATDDAAFERLCSAADRRADIARGLKALAERHADAIRERFPRIPRRVSGYNLPQLLPENGFDLAKALVGTEGTCVVVLEARLRLVHRPPSRSLLVLGYPSVYEAGDHVPEVMQAKPVALEGVDDRLVSDMERNHLHPEGVALLPEGGGWLLVEFGGDTPEDASAQARQLMERLRGAQGAPSMKLIEDPQVQAMIWSVREAGLGATAHVPGEHLTWEGWEDSSVPPERLGDYLRALRKLFEAYGYGCDLYGHFGQGCVHTRIDFDLRSAPGIEKYRRFIREAAELVVRFDGSISGEHGDGQSKGELLPIMYGEELVRAFEEFKAIWDPQGKMNPGKVVHPYRSDENLRLGTGYAPEPVETVMHFAADHGDFARATLRCVGVGECRKKSGTMCPSYMATGEEMHSTRGRAHLLFEMLNASRADATLHPPWQEPAVKEALDLCLSCKGCKAECPVKVDMASYKAEFMHHWHQHAPRPLLAHAFGHVDRWSRLAAHAPGLANFFSQTAPFSTLAKRIVGIAAQRRIPPFAPRTFLSGFRDGPSPAGAGEVLLWADTFNNHFHPQVAHAAVDVLRHAGFRVRVPPGGLCCGRPLYEFGFLHDARRYLQRITEALGEDLRAGTPIVVLEPACLSVFKEELPQMLPNDQQARRLREQSMLLPDFLERHAPQARFEPPVRRALVHGHCHHKSVLDFAGEKSLLADRLGLALSAPDTGCCGMAGSFGFEAHKYEVSIACGERVLLPAVREWSEDDWLVADGYSCREQIHQCTGREALHIAQALQQALPARARTSRS